MPRYFIRVAYKGTNYAGFQVQDNANSVQAEVEKSLSIFFKASFQLTCSSRTDAGVHALCNYFHFDSDILFDPEKLARSIYNLNAILPADIVITNIINVPGNAHCRFDALSREYEYYIYKSKNPFLSERAFYYPYSLDVDILNASALLIKQYADFTTFSKRNTQVKTFNCTILESKWIIKEDCVVYSVKANRFLRGMVRGLVGTMLRVGTGRINIDAFKAAIESKDCSQADFSVPPQGLFLVNVNYPESLPKL
ncbi:MAG: tRNA pseudouridine(38-40) synthase TruA [Bacteroidota bacterium]